MVYLDKRRAQEAVIEAIAAGAKVEDAMNMVERAVKTYEGWRAEDPDFARKVDEARKARDVARARGLDNRFATMDFETWRKEFLDRDTFAHQKVWIDLLEGRDPTLRPGETLIEGSPNRLIISTPPFHAKSLALDTPLLTPNGWTTIGNIRVGQRVFGLDGKPTTVIAKSPVFHKPCFRVVVNDGEEFVSSEDHLWTVWQGKTAQQETLTTRQLFERGGEWKLPFHDELHIESAEYPLDPYLLGCWLGDGHTSSGQFTTADPEIVAAFAARFQISERVVSVGKGRASTYSALGLFPILAELGVKGSKFIPEGYLLGSAEQRQALLQGLMDTDGTCSPAGQASFTSTNRDLAEGVLYLASSLGLRPSIRKGRATLNGRDCGPKWTVWFHPGDVECFRLPRKLDRQVRTAGVAPGRGRRARRIVAIEPVQTVPTQCISVDNDSHLFLIGKSLIPTHNSSTITIDYATYRICMNPNVRIILVSKKAEQAKKFLYAIKMRLTSSRFAKLQAAYAPSGGFKAGRGDAWTANMIYVAGRDSAEKDPTVEALGIGGQIYGARADLIILDDVVTLTNAGEWSKQMEWINQEVASRLYGGKLLVVGTRVAPQDLYSELLNGENYLSGRSPWTHLRQPAVLAFSDDPKDWKTLWPASTEPLDEEQKPLPDGTYEAWSGPKLFEIRSNLPPKTWSLVYMQQQVAENMTFDPTCVWGSVNRRRKPGPLVAGALDHPPRGLEGQWVIASMDPAMSGDTFTVVGAVDRQTSKRHIMNAWVKTNPHPTYIRDLIKEVTETYRVNEWVIEQNAFQLFLVHDPEIRQFLASRGVTLTPHFTGRNKQDPDFGVASVAPLFGTTRSSEESGGRRIHNKDNLITLPDPDLSEGIKVLLEELFVWEPGRLGRDLRQDGPMALWFFELRARAVLGHGKAGVQSSFLHNPYLTKADRSRRVVVPMHEYRAG